MENSVSRYDIEGLAEDLGVDMESIWGLFSSYMEEMNGEMESMQQLLEKQDWYMLERIVHNIKGVSANLGITDVFSEAEKFDILLKREQTQTSDKCVENLIQLIKSAEKEIRRFFKQKGLSM